jgi:hypothetical protein
MVENSPINGPQSRPVPGSAEISSTESSRTAKKKTEANEGPAFKALLDKLQQQARSLQAESETIARPEELSGAVDRARSSLDDALSLSDQLLEAFRETMHNDGAEGPTKTEE